MYAELERELFIKKITRKKLAEILGISTSTLSCKMNGKNDFTYGECLKIKKFINYEKPIDELFKTQEE